MNIKFIQLFCLVAGLIWAGTATAEVQVSARIDRTQAVLGESLQLRVTIEGADGSLEMQDIPGFKVISRGSGTSMQFVNGRTSRQKTYNFMLIPQKQGSLTIPALAVDVDGREHTTEPITIFVKPPLAGDTDDNDKPRDVWVEAEVSPQEAFTGQQIIYTFSLFNTVQVSDAKFQPPDFDGFDARELEKRTTFHKTVNGREHVITQVHYILIPRRAESLTIAPAGLQIGVVRPDNRRRTLRGFDSIFDDPFFNRGVVEQRFLQTQPLEIQVNSLPAYKGGEPFSGLVGRFDLAAAIENNDLKVGDSTTLTITLSGQGNILDAPSPALNIPSSFKTYADAPEDEIHMSPEGYSGKKIFRIALVPVEPGEFTLSPASLSYFDIEEQDYITLSAAPMHIVVAPSAMARTTPLTISPAPLSNSKQTVAFTGRDILPLKEELDAVVPRRPLGLKAFIAWLVFPLVPFWGLALVQRMRNQDQSPGQRMKLRARQSMKLAARAGNDREALLGHLYQALSAAILAASGRSGEALTWKEAEKILIDGGHDAAAAERIAGLLARIETSKFSGMGLPDKQLRELRDSTRKMVRRLAP